MKDLAVEPPPQDEGTRTERISRDTKIKLAVATLAAFWLVVVAVSWAEAAPSESDTTISRSPAAASSSNGDDEYSFSWLDPEKKIYVLQNRRYTKGRKPLISLMVGPGLSNSYRNSLNVEPRLAYYFNETWGIEGFYTATLNRDNNTVEALRKATNTTLAVVREIKSEMGVLAHWSPWYAKINVFNKILYFDWYFTGGLGSVHSVLTDSGGTGAAPSGTAVLDQTSMALFLGSGHQFHLTEHFVIRLDFMGAFYNAQIDPLNGDKAWYSNFNFGAGVGIRL